MCVCVYMCVSSILCLFFFCFCLSVVYPILLCLVLFYLILLIFFRCLFVSWQETERVYIPVGGRVGENLGQVSGKKTIIGTYYIKSIFNKRKKEKRRSHSPKFVKIYSKQEYWELCRNGDPLWVWSFLKLEGNAQTPSSKDRRLLDAS